jgi:N-hydroxyarylamine O-acetyltransferase
MDLDAYFGRIGYRGARAPVLETVQAIVRAHVQAIPFENIDVLLGRAIALDRDALVDKLVHRERGGYCFEHNTLLLEVLSELGFEVRPLSARVRYQRPREYTPARTHLLVRVELEESWLADVGVGSMSSTAALRLADHGEQATPHEPRRLLRESGLIYHQVRLDGEWHDVAELTLEEMPVIDRIVANWYTSTHPQSHFKHRLQVARATPTGRKSLRNDLLTIREGDGTTRTQIESPAHLLAVLAEHFGIVLPAGTSVPYQFG